MPAELRYPRTAREREMLRLSVRAMREKGMPYRVIADILDVPFGVAYRARDVEAERARKPWLAKPGA